MRGSNIGIGLGLLIIDFREQSTKEMSARITFEIFNKLKLNYFLIKQEIDTIFPEIMSSLELCPPMNSVPFFEKA